MQARELESQWERIRAGLEKGPSLCKLLSAAGAGSTAWVGQPSGPFIDPEVVRFLIKAMPWRQSVPFFVIKLRHKIDSL